MDERHIVLHHHLAATDDAGVGDGVVRRPEGTCAHDSGTCAGEAGDAVDAGAVEGFGEGHRRARSSARKEAPVNANANLQAVQQIYDVFD
jgi:hypothetical protein